MSTVYNPFRYALAASSVASAYTVRNSTPTEPSGAGIFDLLKEGLGVVGRARESIPTYLQLVPFGSDANNETIGLQVFGWTPTVPTAGLVTTTPIYIPQHIATLGLTLCARTFSDYAANYFLVDTLSVVKGPADNGIWSSMLDTAGGSNEAVGSMIIHTRGCRYISFDPIVVTGAAANCLWRPFEF